MNLLALIGRDTQLKRTCARQGGEYSGPCPLCRCGTDRFKVWPRLERWACLGPKAGRNGCDRSGDAIQYLRERDGLTYREACNRLNIDPGARMPGSAAASPPFRPAPLRPCVDPLSPPNPTWQAHARGWAARCEALLWRPEGERARSYLRKRGLQDGILRAFHLGYNPEDTREDHAQWGLTPPDDGPGCIWIPRGVVFPWIVAGGLWRLNVRRPLTPAQIAAGEAKYIGPAGFANALYNADALPGANGFAPDRPVVLVEGEIDALTIVQACGDEVSAVATGSTAGARRDEWIARLAAAPIVLLAFDADTARPGGPPGAGDRAAAWWLNALANARRWRPPAHDVNTLPDPGEVHNWVRRGLG